MLVSTLKGKTITVLTLSHIGELIIETEDNKKYSYYHTQDCCEYVRPIKTIGDVDKIIGKPICLAEDDNPSDPEWYKGNYDDSHTWSVLILATEDARVEFWFLGESNGYYCESMEFDEIKNND